MRPLAGHGVKRLVGGKLEAVVTAVASASIGHRAAQALDHTRPTRFEISHRVEVAFARPSDSGGSEKYLVINLIPKVQVSHHHLARGDGHSLVSVSVDHVDMFVAFRGENHGKLSAIFSK